MKTFKVLSLLLCYPESDWLAALPEMESALAAETDFNGNAATSPRSTATLRIRCTCSSISTANHATEVRR